MKSPFENPDFNQVIHNLIHLEHDAIAAYKQTADRLETPAYKTQIASFMADHERHLSELTSLGKSLNADIPDGGDFKTILTQGKVVLADLVGDDASILKAMKTNEDETVMAYSQASQHPNIPGHAKEILTRAHQDEVRHRAWMQETAMSESNSKAA